MKKKILNSKIPLAVKVSPDIDDKEIKKICEVLLNNNIELIIISNTSDATRENLKIFKDIKKEVYQANLLKKNLLN